MPTPVDGDDDCCAASGGVRTAPVEQHPTRPTLGGPWRRATRRACASTACCVRVRVLVCVCMGLCAWASVHLAWARASAPSRGRWRRRYRTHSQPRTQQRDWLRKEGCNKDNTCR